MIITGKTKLNTLLNKYPQLAETLMSKYGLHCVGCFSAAFETLEQGAQVHGMTKKQIAKMIEDLNNQISKKNDLKQIVKALRAGGLVVFPTDTVWGVGVDAANIGAVKKLYQLKKRSPYKPTAVLIGSVKQAKKMAVFDKYASQLAKKFWPGGLTLVLQAKKGLPTSLQNKTKTVGLRLPNYPLVKKIALQLPFGLLASSANYPKQLPPIKKSDLDPQFLQAVDLVLTGKSIGKKASTVIDFTVSPVKILRNGAVLTGKLPLDK